MLTTILKGAAKTATEKATQIHPTTATRVDAFIGIYDVVKKMTKNNDPIFSEENNFNVPTCNSCHDSKNYSTIELLN